MSAEEAISYNPSFQIKKAWHAAGFSYERKQLTLIYLSGGVDISNQVVSDVSTHLKLINNLYKQNDKLRKELEKLTAKNAVNAPQPLSGNATPEELSIIRDLRNQGIMPFTVEFQEKARELFKSVFNPSQVFPEPLGEWHLSNTKQYRELIAGLKDLIDLMTQRGLLISVDAIHAVLWPALLQAITEIELIAVTFFKENPTRTQEMHDSLVGIANKAIASIRKHTERSFAKYYETRERTGADGMAALIKTMEAAFETRLQPMASVDKIDVEEEADAGEVGEDDD